MKKRQIFGAILFGAMLALTGCGDDSGDNGGGTGGSNGGTGGSSGSGFCATLCNSCAMDEMGACTNACEQQLDSLGGFVDLDSCPNQLSALGDCFENNGCDTDACDNEYSAWFTCVVGGF